MCQDVVEAADCVVFSKGCSTVRQPMVEEVSSGEDDPYYVEFICSSAASQSS